MSVSESVPFAGRVDAQDVDADVTLAIRSLHIYPVKSCAGIDLDESLLIETGLDLDRAWMVVDAATGRFVSQRELPRMALIRPALKSAEMVLRAPGMLALHIALDGVEAPTRVHIWADEVDAYDMGDLCAQWFSDFLVPAGQGRGNATGPASFEQQRAPLRLVRFDPEQKRLADRRWTGEFAAETAFSDGFPILVISTAGMDELNRRLTAAGEPAATSARFRPNLVLDGLDANGEDALDEIVFTGAEGPIRLRLVKPCPRCPIPDVDPATGANGHAVGDALAAYRADARLDGRLTFGMNAVIVDGIDRVLRRGMRGTANFRFD